MLVHKIANLLDNLPRLQPKAKTVLHEAMNAPTVAECNKSLDSFLEAYTVQVPKATKSLVEAREKLVTHFELPAEH
jgi:transposase-like protein